MYVKRAVARDGPGVQMATAVVHTVVIARCDFSLYTDGTANVIGQQHCVTI